jgi:hypothetical protein
MMVITTPGGAEDLKKFGFKPLDTRGDFVLLGTESAAKASPK